MANLERRSIVSKCLFVFLILFLCVLDSYSLFNTFYIKKTSNKWQVPALRARSGALKIIKIYMDKSFNSNFATRMAVAPFSNI